MEYSINLMLTLLDTETIASYKSSFVPMVGDFIVLNENTTFQVEKRVYSTRKPTNIIVTGIIIKSK